MKIGAIDIGTNSMRLLIADYIYGRLFNREKFINTTRIGQGVDSKGYIRNNFCDILKFENVIEKRLTGDLRIEELYKTNDYNLEQCMFRIYNHVLIDDDYQINTVDI